jgi:CHAT domain-containing protein
LAREPLEQAQTLWRAAENPFEEEEATGNLCNLEGTVGPLRESLACYEKNLAFFQVRGVGNKEASIRFNLGRLHDLLGEPDEALACYGKALALQQSSGDSAAEADTLIHMAVVHRTLGEWQEALSLYDRARTLLAPLGDEARENLLLNNVGFLYSATGNPQRALAYFAKSLAVNVKLRNVPGQIVSLNNLGTAWRTSGNSAKALELHGRALALARSEGNAVLEASSRQRLAEVHLDRSEAAGALREIEAALPVLREKGGPRTQAEALNLEGRALTLAGRAKEARPVLQDALTRRRELRDRAGEAETLYSLALAERSLGQTADALSHADEAVTGIEKLRTGFLSTDLRASFLATRRRAFSLLIDLLMDQDARDPGKGYDQQAFAVSERARARSLLDVLRAGSGGPSGPVPAALVEQRTSLLRSLSAKIEQGRLQRGERAEALQRQIEADIVDLERVEAEIRSQAPRFEAFSAPKPVGVNEISSWLEPGTTLLEYSLGEGRSFLWAIADGRLQSFILPDQKEIETLARQVYEEMSRPASERIRRGEAAARLSRLLLGPLWSGSGATRLRRLIVVPDGALGILPFAALPVPEPGKSWQSPKDFLVEHLEVVYIPSATTLGAQRQWLERRTRATKRAAVLADPVFDVHDPRLTSLLPTRNQVSRKPAGKKPAAAIGPRGAGDSDPSEALERLPSTRAEAEAISALAPGQVWLSLGLEANRDAVLSGRLRDFRILHFATHATADSRNPELSGLFLSQVDAEGHPQQGFLGLSDIYQLDLEADLVVLSGCRTALGKEVRGEGVMGLTRGFQYAGVPQVVASLWRVQDRATAELMIHFYQAMWRRGGLSPAAALHEAQKAILRRYRDPYLWAGFVLQGDWRAEADGGGGPSSLPSESRVRQSPLRRQ